MCQVKNITNGRKYLIDMILIAKHMVVLMPDGTRNVIGARVNQNKAKQNAMH